MPEGAEPEPDEEIEVHDFRASSSGGRQSTQEEEEKDATTNKKMMSMQEFSQMKR